MTEEKTIIDASPAELDERSIATRYGVRPLVYPDVEQLRTITAFLSESFESGRCGAIPDGAVLATLEFVQAILNRQHITKGPRMPAADYDLLQRPYSVATRIISRMQRERRESAKGHLYQTTHLSLTNFLDVLRSLLDPACSWADAGTIPTPVRLMMSALRDFLIEYPDQQRKTVR
jgi:hypothetical protein